MSEAALLSRPNYRNSVSGSILIIDDESAIRESLETLLEFEGFSVESAETGEDGLIKLAIGPLTWYCLTSLCPTVTAWRFWLISAAVTRSSPSS